MVNTDEFNEKVKEMVDEYFGNTDVGHKEVVEDFLFECFHAEMIGEEYLRLHEESKE